MPEAKFSFEDVAVGSVRLPEGFLNEAARRVRAEVLGSVIRERTEPVIAVKQGDALEVVAGCFQVLACRRRGQERLGALVGTLSEDDALVLRIVEGGRRGEVGPVEEAEILQRLNREFGMTQTEIATRCGMKQCTVANKIRLLRLPDSVLGALRDGRIGERHARALLRVEDPERQKELFERCLRIGLRARDLESLCRPVSLRGRGRRDRAVIKDLRIFQNALRDVARDMSRAGLIVEYDETARDGEWEFRLAVRV